MQTFPRSLGGRTSAGCNGRETGLAGIASSAQGPTLGSSAPPSDPRFSPISLRRLLPPRLLALPLRLYFAAPGTAHRRTGAGCSLSSALTAPGSTARCTQQQSIPVGSGEVLCAAKSRRKAGTAGLGDIRGAEYPGALIGSWPLWADHALGRLLEGLIAARPSAGGELRCPWLVRRRAAPGSANVPRGS